MEESSLGFSTNWGVGCLGKFIADFGLFFSIISFWDLSGNSFLSLFLLCNTSTRTTALSHSENFSIVGVVHWRWRCWVCRWAICQSMVHFLLLISSKWCLRTIRTLICWIRLFTACWRWWRFILACNWLVMSFDWSWSTSRQMSTLHKLVVINHPKWTKIVFVTYEAFMKRKICSDGILMVGGSSRETDSSDTRTKLAHFWLICIFGNRLTKKRRRLCRRIRLWLGLCLTLKNPILPLQFIVKDAFINHKISYTIIDQSVTRRKISQK